MDRRHRTVAPDRRTRREGISIFVELDSTDEEPTGLKYYHFADKKRALMSRLMTRAACAKARECKFEEVIIGRTKGRKPFFQNVHEVVDQPLLSPSTNGVSNNDSSISNDNMSTNEDRIGIANAPNFNFNVSHEGKYVVLVSEPYAICGVGVAHRTNFAWGIGQFPPSTKFLRRLIRRYIRAKKSKF